MAKKIEESSSGESGSESESGSGSGSGSDSGSGSGSGSGSDSDSDSGSGSGSGSDSGSGSGSDSGSDSEGEKKKDKSPAKAKKEPAKAAAKKSPQKAKAKKAAGKADAAVDESKMEEIDPEKLKGLNEVEKEALILEHYESQTQKSKEIALKRKLESEKEALDDDNEAISNRRLRNRDTDRRKEALSNLKQIKQTEKGGKSILRNRFKDDDEDDDGFRSDGSDAGREIAEKRRRRKELQQTGSHKDESRSSDKKASKKASTDEVKLQEIDVSGPIDLKYANSCLHKRRQFFEKHYFEPYFEKIIKGVYCKVALAGEDDERVYRFCQVQHTCKMDKEYMFMGEATKTGVMLAYGKDTRAWRLDLISNHSVTEREFLLWKYTVQKVNLPIMTQMQAKKFYAVNKAIATMHKYNDEQVTTMVTRKKAAGQTKVALGVERVRLERDVKAAKNSNDFEKALALEDRLNKVLAENKSRLAVKADEVQRINEINKRNREINQRRDLDAAVTNQQQMDNMTAAQKLQYVRATASRRMFMSRDKMEKNLADGKLLRMPDGRIMTVNKLQEVEALPDDMIPETKAKKQDGGHAELVEKIKERQARALEDESKPDEAMANDIEFVDGQPVDVTDVANLTIRYKDDDGTWTTMRPAAEILKEKEAKIRPVIPEAEKVQRKGLTMKEYFERVKRRAAEDGQGDNKHPRHS
ncbi:hypothetical protein SDRG_10694 [Saprolegnia diclina VS20]|uniref:Plus3 domain-containing protein n=1 Tax=Saprolegnia diclina (strain VS20) TaxID=1156394 RepID=T0QD95_SAPDV|nr:hypothetical protein SDRG_10694 [Saprolegnia diclina VS20]EQC31520.1 hypothetical protein SDRG_10694 [Saprolegnia diclina VS20]|eukprot:XP_008614919.1 hypothetical protein SDRG_10694 [Saprolegnia diclina VS20]